MSRHVSRSLALAAVSLFLMSFVVVVAQQQQGDDQDERIVVSSSEVALDAVIKDKKGRPVKDLTVGDFEIYEDGARQQIKSLRLITRATNAPASGDAIAAAGDDATAAASFARPRADSADAPGTSAVALVFDRLSPSARALARDAALGYAGEGGRGQRIGEYVGVFNIDLSLRVMQSYTKDSQAIRRAIGDAVSRSTSSYASNVGDIQNIAQQQARLGATAGSGAPAPGTSGGASSTPPGGAGVADGIFLAMAQRSLEVFEMLERDQQGYATTNGLLAVVNSMQRLSGRKAIIFFSEGLALPPAARGYFRAVINSANRAGVSIYAVDAAGLRVFSGNDVARQEIGRMANQGLDREGDPRGRPLTMGLERNEDLLRANPQSGLEEMAGATGGFLIRDTNDIGNRLRQVDEDLNTYYLLTYTPQNQNYDGRFRQIAVRVNRSNTEIQARKGYYALNASFTEPILSYEAPALAALSGDKRPDDFPLRLGGFSFPENDRPGLVALLAEAPPNSFAFGPDQSKKAYQTDFSVVMLIRDANKQVVKKISNRYVLTGPIEKVDAARKSGELLFYREVELPPGNYSVEAAAFDALAGKTSVRTALLAVPPAGANRIRLSDIALIKRVEKVGGTSNASTSSSANPFTLGDVLAYPNLNEPVSKAKSKQMAVFFTAYVPPTAEGKSAAAPTKLTISFAQNGRPVGKISGDLAKADATGRIQHASTLPLDGFQPGVYDMRVEVSDGGDVAARQMRLVIDP